MTPDQRRAGHVFFTAPIWLNPTANIPIPDRPAKFLFFAPITKYLDEIFPNPDDPEVYILSPDILDTDQTGLVSGPFHVCVCCYLSSFLLFVGVYQCISFHLLPKFSPDCKKVPAPRQNYPRSRPDPFPGSRTGPSPRIKQNKAPWSTFFGGCMVRSGGPRRSKVPCSSLPPIRYPTT